MKTVCNKKQIIQRSLSQNDAKLMRIPINKKKKK